MIEQDGVRIERREIDLGYPTALSAFASHRWRYRSFGLRAIAGKSRPAPAWPHAWLEAAPVKQIGTWSSSPHALVHIDSSVPVADCISSWPVTSARELDVFTSVDSAEVPLRWSPPARIVAFRLCRPAKPSTTTRLRSAGAALHTCDRFGNATDDAPHVASLSSARILFGRGQCRITCVGRPRPGLQTIRWPPRWLLARQSGQRLATTRTTGRAKSSGGEQALRAPTHRQISSAGRYGRS